MVMNEQRKELTSEAIAVLRRCILPVYGVEFLRCGRDLGITKARQIATEICEVLGDNSAEVFHSFNADTGHNDYVRVNRGTKAFMLICQMKS